MTYFKLYLVVLKVSLMSFGGAYSIWALLEGELVGKCAEARTGTPRVCQEDFNAVLAVSEIMPGPQVNPISIVAHKTWGVSGMLCLILALVTPGLLLIPVLHRAYAGLRRSNFLRLFMSGVILATVGILISFVLRISGMLVSGVNFQTGVALLLIFCSFWATHWGKINPLFLVMACGAVGFVLL